MSGGDNETLQDLTMQNFAQNISSAAAKVG